MSDDPQDSTRGASERITRTAHGVSGEQERIGPYRILELVGSGGMGQVYRAEQTHPIRRIVAIKVIKRGMDTKEVIARFEAERQALALMDHPSIAKVFEAGSTPRGRPYFAMEYVQGEPINRYCDKQKLTTHARLKLFIELCEGVQHAHQKAIIHRDLKPSNVLVTIQNDKPIPKIIDFGVAKATAQKLTEKTMYTSLGELIGTPEYMSPEQAEMTGANVDTRTDVYALGVILYELLAGALPFEPRELRARGFEGIVQMIREQDPLRPSTRASTLGERTADVAAAHRTLPAKLSSQLRGDLDWITMKALEKDRTRRYGSPSDFAADVRRHLRHEPVLAGPPSVGYRARKFVRRHRAGVGVVGAVLMSIALGFAESNRQRVKAELERAKAETALKESEAVTDFLVGVFNVSDPGEARGNTVTAREVLDNGAVRIQQALREQPLLRATMMHAMGNVYKGLGLTSVAESLLVGALEIRQRELGGEHPKTFKAFLDVAELRHWSGKSDETATFERALTQSERIHGPDHLETARVMVRLGNILGGSKGRDYLEAALPILETELGPGHSEVGSCVNKIGIKYGATGDLATALPLLQRALDIQVNALGPDHHFVGAIHQNIGYTLTLMGRLDEAKSHIEQGLAIHRRNLGPENESVGNALHSLGELLRRLGDHAAARDTLDLALQIRLKKVGPEDWRVAEVLQSQALNEWALGKPARADSLFQRVLKSCEAHPEWSYTDRAQTLEDYARFLRATGRAKEADAMEARAGTIRERREHENGAQ